MLNSAEHEKSFITLGPAYFALKEESTNVLTAYSTSAFNLPSLVQFSNSITVLSFKKKTQYKILCWQRSN